MVTADPCTVYPDLEIAKKPNQLIFEILIFLMELILLTN